MDFTLNTLGASWREGLRGVVTARELEGARWQTLGHATEAGVLVTLADGRRFRLWRDVPGGAVLAEKVPS